MTRWMILLVLSGCVPPTSTKDTAPPDTTDTSETDTSDTGSGPPPDPLPAQEGTISAENSAGRHGAWYLPEGYNTHPVPFLLGFHGTGGEGTQMVSAFKDLAVTWGFGIVAPDSRATPEGVYTWEVATTPGLPTEDLLFAQTCLNEVLDIDGVELDRAHVMAAGFSGGGSSAPYLATWDDRFTRCAVLHGGVFPDGLGDHMVTCWFSTGTDDTVRSPDHVQGQADSMQAAGFPVVYEEFPGGHELTTQEKEALITWWLDGA